MLEKVLPLSSPLFDCSGTAQRWARGRDAIPDARASSAVRRPGRMRVVWT